jgi:hypothetical protein
VHRHIRKGNGRDKEWYVLDNEGIYKSAHKDPILWQIILIVQINTTALTQSLVMYSHCKELC